MQDRFDAHVLAAFGVFSRVGSAVCMLFGLFVLGGWILDGWNPHAIRLSLLAMSPRSALGIVLAGLSLCLRNLGRPPTAAVCLAVRCCGVLLLGGSVGLLVWHALTGHDLLNPLMSLVPDAGGSVAAGRVASTSVFCFALLGASLLLLEARGAAARRLGDGCTLAGLLIAGVAVLGYAYDVQELHALMAYRSMALRTGVALFVLFLVCLTSEPEQGWAAVIASGQPGARNSRVQLLLVTLVPFLIGLVALRGVRQGLLTPGLAMAIVVASTVVSLVVRILRDGSALDDLETRRRTAVAAQIRLTEELEQRVRDRTASLALSEARLRTYFDNAPEGLLLIRVGADGGFTVESISPSLRRMYHLGNRETSDIRLDTLFVPEAVADMRAQVALCLQSGLPHRYMARREIAGNVRLLDVILAPVPAGPDGSHLIAGSVRDVTDAERREEQLRQSQKMEAVGQLTGGLAHDFNNLLTGITGSLELMTTRIAQGRISDLGRHIDRAQEAADRAASLTHRLLAFSRRQTLDPRAIDVTGVIAGIEELVRRTVGPEIAVEVTADPDPWIVLIDANQIENALLNLCLNARDAMPGGGRLSIAVANVTVDATGSTGPDPDDVPAGHYVRLSVTDTGTGMTPSVMARAFDPFFTTKPIGQGTGLGLSMIYGFMHQSGGHVRITSAPGAGTTVWLYLRRHEILPASAALDGASRPLPAGGAAARDEIVLVVDDEQAIRTIVVEVLDELGYRTIQAEDAAGALAVLQSAARIDLLVSDVGLPNGMNGRQLADAARLVRPDLKVLFITGYAQNAVIGDGGLPSGMQVLTKPFTMRRLTSRIEAMLEASALTPA